MSMPAWACARRTVARTPETQPRREPVEAVRLQIGQQLLRCARAVMTVPPASNAGDTHRGCSTVAVDRRPPRTISHHHASESSAGRVDTTPARRDYSKPRPSCAVCPPMNSINVRYSGGRTEPPFNDALNFEAGVAHLLLSQAYCITQMADPDLDWRIRPYIVPTTVPTAHQPQPRETHHRPRYAGNLR
jgi:hypothetical protein